MSQTFEFGDLVLLCQHIRAISATPSRISQESMRQIPQTLSVESSPPNSAILQTPSAKFTIRDSEIPGIGPTLSVELMTLASLEIRQTVAVESVAPETINVVREI